MSRRALVRAERIIERFKSNGGAECEIAIYAPVRKVARCRRTKDNRGARYSIAECHNHGCKNKH